MVSKMWQILKGLNIFENVKYVPLVNFSKSQKLEIGCNNKKITYYENEGIISNHVFYFITKSNWIQSWIGCNFDLHKMALFGHFVDIL